MVGDRTDLVIVGGGPAGLAAAIRAHIRGLRAVVLDRRRPPIDRACGEGLMPAGVARLGSLGVNLDSCDGAAFAGVRYVDGSHVAEGRFVGASGLGIRRTKLHEALVQRAEEVGVDLRWGSVATGVVDGAVQTSGGEIDGSVVVGADGRLSRMRRWTGLDLASRGERRFGIRRHYAVEPWTDLVEVHWGDGCEAYVTPVDRCLVGVALLWSGRRAGFDQLIANFPSLARRLEGARVASKDRGAGPLEQRCRGVVRNNVVLLGDASGALDAISGEGLTLAFEQAFALVDAVEAGDLSRYERTHRALRRVPLILTKLLLIAERRPELRSRLVRALAVDPLFFGRVISTLGESRPVSSLGIAAPLRFLSRMAAPA